MDQHTIKDIEKKYQSLDQDPNTYLKGLYHSKPITYWDYIQVDTLLSLQNPRTNFSDEPIFIMYHQVTELLLKLIVHELKQVVELNPDAGLMAEKISRVNRYAQILTQSFSVMREGMDYDQYNQFRLALAPASGFQSVQFRYIELYCTDVCNLVNHRIKDKVNKETALEELFDNFYWLDAGVDRKTGKKSLTLQQFLDKYFLNIKKTAAECKESNVLRKFEKLNSSENKYNELKTALRNFDKTYNVEWPLAHLKTAEYYLDLKGENKAATGGSEWKKYLHPSYQRRIFFPSLWTEEELNNWGNF